MTGSWDNLRAEVRGRIDELVASGREAGVQVAAYLHGTRVVDEVAGVADRATGRPLTSGTPIWSVSTGKGLTATVVHVLAERGLLDYDLRIAEVWPEFARHGKDGVTLRHVLTHTAGVPALPPDVTVADVTDWDRMCGIVADSVPLSAPGDVLAYHAWTFGWLVGEVVRRVTGRRISRVLAEDVAGPLGVPGELLFGVPEAELGRLAPVADRNLSALLDWAAANLPNFDRVAPPGLRPDASVGTRDDFLRADVPATGTMSARAVARMFAALIGEVDGVRLISPERLREVSAVAVRGTEWVFGQEGSFGLGYAVEPDGAFGSAGSGGSLAYAYPDLGLTVAATKTLLGAGDGDPMEELRVLIRDAVRVS
ncbi:serine hydrolase domain-containing protein [Micromonospora sp. DSM 115977]|uniref:Serine hydrolase domain-containing protein n=1 Tax=Micromonospora reichwaldensis TaxID=3075516 RepID=A0ABU2X0B7_9ACTN|nr:serine hydrolase domain-containing protein [Micromonospora sp. DSM 115977]MDT0531631.1 serine hydrolase domain-containing protein [Micromonospora sp. DSM 115977]